MMPDASAFAYHPPSGAAYGSAGRVPGTEDRNTIGVIPLKRDKATDSPDDYPDEKEA